MHICCFLKLLIFLLLCFKSSLYILDSSYYFLSIFNVYLFIFEWGKGGVGREGDRIPSRLRAVSAETDMGLEITDCEIMT